MDNEVQSVPETLEQGTLAAYLALNEARAENNRLRAIKDFKQRNGLNFYRPHLKQHKFHSCTATGRYGRTGNRFGKSEMGIAEDLAWCMGGRIWYQYPFDILNGDREVAQHHPGGKSHPLITQGIPQHPVKGLVIVVDWDMAKKIFTSREGSYEAWGKLFKLLPQEAIGKCTLSRGGHLEKVEIKRPREFGGGSSTLTFDTIESYKHNRLGAESADWDFIHVDEPCPELMFKAHSRGLMDRDGSYWFTCTPLDEMWINDRFCPPSTNMVKDAGEGTRFDRKYIITGSIYDNPHRTDSGVAEFESGLTREEKECRLYGLPLAMAGLVYREFVYDMHVLCEIPAEWKDYHNPPLDYTIRVAWDVHQRIPQALLFAATAPNGDVFIYDEQFFDPLIGPNAELLQRKTDGRNVLDRLIDPFAVVPSAVTGESVLDILSETYNLYFEKASKDLTTGVSSVRERLAERSQVSKLPTIFFSPNLKQTLFEFTHYVYDTEKNEPKDKDNHMMENLYRLVLNGLDYVAPSSPTDYKRRKTIISGAEVRRSSSMFATPKLTI